MSAQSVLTRDDTMFGVCFALGADFGFSPTYARLGFAILLFFNPLAAAGAYGALGTAVALSRWLAPDPVVSDAEPVEEPAEASHDLPLAA